MEIPPLVAENLAVIGNSEQEESGALKLLKL